MWEFSFQDESLVTIDGLPDAAVGHPKTRRSTSEGYFSRSLDFDKLNVDEEDAVTGQCRVRVERYDTSCD